MAAAILQLDVHALQRLALRDERVRQALEVLHLPFIDQLTHLRDGGRGGAEFRAAVDESHAVRLRSELQHPVQGGITTTKNHQPFSVEVARVLDAVVDTGALENIGTLDTDATRLERADACGDYDRPCGEHGARSRPDLS